MKIEKIITMANMNTKIQFLAMERSLRNVGCNLPISVIPYDEKTFDLPENSDWLVNQELFEFLRSYNAKNVMRKYQCLLEEKYQFLDTDVIVLQSPESTLLPYNNFVTSCCHWHNPSDTLTDRLYNYLRNKTTTWQKNVFNTGQFACDTQLYNLRDLKSTMEDPLNYSTCISHPSHEQPGINLLVNLKNTPITNLTLPPINMESTWAGDYTDNYDQYWVDENLKPYIMHWAGRKADGSLPIDSLFYDYLSQSEISEYKESIKPNYGGFSVIRNRLRKCKQAMKVLVSE